MEKRTRVLFMTKSTGGLAHYNTTLVKGINQDEFDIHVLCLSENNENYAAYMRELGAKATTLDMERYAINPLADLRLMREIYKFIKQENFDVILAHGSKAGFIGRLVGRLTRTPAIFCLASMSFVPRIQGRKAYLYRILEYIASLAGGHIVVLSKSTRDELLRLRISDEEHTSIIYTGIDLERFKPSHSRAEACEALGLDPERPVCGWAARFAPQKDPLNFVRIAAQVVAQVPNVQIFMAGEGDLRAEAEALAAELGVADHILFAAWQEDVPLMLSAFDVYVLNSRWEGLPLSLLEAMAMQRACVATAVDGTKEVIQHDIDGFLVEPGAIEATAQYISTLLQDKERRNNVGERARQRVEALFGLQGMIDNWEALLKNYEQ